MKTVRFGRTVAMALFGLTLSAGAALAQQSSLDRAGALMDKKDYKSAIVILDRLIRQDPQNAKALVMRADAKDDLADTQGALADYNAAIQINPQYEYAYASRCGVENELSRFKDAIADCTKALTLQTNDDYALRSRAYAYFYLDDYQLSSADAEQALAIDGKNPWNILARCRADVGLRRLDEGFKACDSVVALMPDDTSGYFYRARAEMMTGKADQAKTDFHKALQIDDTDTTIHYWLAVIAVDQKNYNEAIGEADAYLASNANDADSLLVRAGAEAGLGKVDAAKYDARTALRRYQIQNDTDGMSRAQRFLDALDKK
jgi:tetratricopeptide (TPR) repeat protein